MYHKDQTRIQEYRILPGETFFVSSVQIRFTWILPESSNLIFQARILAVIYTEKKRFRKNPSHLQNDY
jgi:hypothetical protein